MDLLGAAHPECDQGAMSTPLSDHAGSIPEMNNLTTKPHDTLHFTTHFYRTEQICQSGERKDIDSSTHQTQDLETTIFMIQTSSYLNNLTLLYIYSS